MWADGALLRWLDRHERQKCEEKPLGLILCAGKKRETVEVLSSLSLPASTSSNT